VNFKCVANFKHVYKESVVLKPCDPLLEAPKNGKGITSYQLIVYSYVIS